jgi:hypothetical protein
MAGHADGVGIYAHCFECGFVAINPLWAVEWVDGAPDDDLEDIDLPENWDADLGSIRGIDAVRMWVSR